MYKSVKQIVDDDRFTEVQNGVQFHSYLVSKTWERVVHATLLVVEAAQSSIPPEYGK